MAVSDSTGSNPSAFRAPSAWIPPALAIGATVLLAGYLATGPHEPNIVIENGMAREDESGTARIWQLLMLSQLPFILWFAAAWLPKDRARAVKVLAIQGFAFVAAAMPVLLLEA